MPRATPTQNRAACAGLPHERPTPRLAFVRLASEPLRDSAAARPAQRRTQPVTPCPVPRDRQPPEHGLAMEFESPRCHGAERRRPSATERPFEPDRVVWSGARKCGAAASRKWARAWALVQPEAAGPGTTQQAKGAPPVPEETMGSRVASQPPHEVRPRLPSLGAPLS